MASVLHAATAAKRREQLLARGAPGYADQVLETPEQLRALLAAEGW